MHAATVYICNLSDKSIDDVIDDAIEYRIMYPLGGEPISALHYDRPKWCLLVSVVEFT